MWLYTLAGWRIRLHSIDSHSAIWMSEWHAYGISSSFVACGKEEQRLLSCVCIKIHSCGLESSLGAMDWDTKISNVSPYGIITIINQTNVYTVLYGYSCPQLDPQTHSKCENFCFFPLIYSPCITHCVVYPGWSTYFWILIIPIAEEWFQLSIFTKIIQSVSLWLRNWNISR